MSAMTEKQIAAYEAKGFNRWTKGSMDRLYVNAKHLGLEVEYYKTGNVSSAKWQGDSISNADARRLLASKVYIDLATCKLHVTTSFDLSDAVSVEDAARNLIAQVERDLDEAEPATSSKRSEVEDKRESLIETVESFIAERIELSESMGLPEEKRAQGVVMLNAARDKTIAAIRSLADIDVMAAQLDGNKLVQAYGLR